MNKKRRGFIKAVFKGGCVLGAGVASGIGAGMTQPLIDTGENTLTSEEYPDTFGRAIDRFKERYGIADVRKAEELYALVIMEAGAHGFGGGIVGPIFCMAANATNLPRFGKGGFVRGLLNMAMSSWVGNGAARAFHEVVETKEATFFMTPKMLVDDYKLHPVNAMRLCRDYKRGYYKSAGAGAFGSSVAYQGVHWLGQGLRAFQRRKEAVELERIENGDFIDVDFEEIGVLADNGDVIWDYPDEDKKPLP